MFTTKTLEDLFHIGRDSIRYYEQIGVLTPKIDQKNGYHYYDDLDIDILSRIVKFRGLDFSLKEIHQLRNSQNIIEYLQQIQAKSLAYQRKAQHYQVIADYLDKTATDIINSIQQKKIFNKTGKKCLIIKLVMITIVILNTALNLQWLILLSFLNPLTTLAISLSTMQELHFQRKNYYLTRFLQRDLNILTIPRFIVLTLTNQLRCTG